ncbi:MAG: hypothetical protein DMF77_08960, partial [Acidobacteria bacterium]
GEILAKWKVRRGEVEVALGRSDVVVVEGTYHTPYQEHAYIEPNGMVAWPEGPGVVVHGSMQCPFYVQKAVASALGCELSHARIVQAVTGGGFGGKEDAPSAPGAQAALLARATGRPVRLIFTREEDMAVMSKRHPGRIRMRTGATRDGHLVACEVDYLLDGGAYATLSPVVLFRGTVHACGPYRVPNVKVDARAVRTNTVPSGAFRGFGEPQVVFAGESQMDRLAERLGMDPLALRRLNALRPGDETITGHRLTTSVGFAEVLDKVAAESGWERKRETFRADRGRRGRERDRGRGHHRDRTGHDHRAQPDHGGGAGVSGRDGEGDGSRHLARPRQRAHRGQPHHRDERERDPRRGREDPRGHGARHRGQRPRLARGRLALRDEAGRPGRARLGGAATTTFDLETGQGEAYICYSWSANVAEVEVDMETGETRVVKVWSGHDAGRVVNPTTGEGQVEGGVLQGLGYALVEEHALREGRILNDQFSTYIIPTTLDTPEIKAILVEHDFPWGPYGAKGLGETPIIAVAPAVTAVIHHAAGVRLFRIPATPERVWAALRAGSGRHSGARCAPTSACSTCSARTCGSPAPRRDAARASAARARCSWTARPWTPAS